MPIPEVKSGNLQDGRARSPSCNLTLLEKISEFVMKLFDKNPEQITPIVAADQPLTYVEVEKFLIEKIDQKIDEKVEELDKQLASIKKKTELLETKDSSIQRLVKYFFPNP